MRFILPFILAVLIGAGFLFYFFNDNSVSTNLLPITNSEKPQPSTQNIVKVGDKEYIYDYFITNNSQDIVLYSNFENSKTSSELVGECKSLVNAGFYQSIGEIISPIGLFIEQGKTISSFQKNDLFNGLLLIDKNGSTTISSTPTGSAFQAVQTGPILISNAKVLDIDVVSDKPSRRVVAFITSQEKLGFAVFYDKSSNFSGPFLEELPKIVMTMAKNQKFEIIDAINLDGGKASVFVNNDTKITELSPIGSYFCIN